MTEYNIDARVRQGRGKGYRNDLVEKGMIPAVVYGKAVGSIPVEVQTKEVEKIIYSDAGRNTLINFSISGDGGAYTVMLKDVQFDPVRREVLHADFQQVDLNLRINTVIPIHLVGEVKEGVLQQVMRRLEISCLPTEIPDSITVSVAGMGPGNAIKVSDLIIPEKIKVLDDTHEIVATVLAGEEETVDVEVPDEKVPAAPVPGDEA